jgi:hypothetical protein
MTAFDRYYSKLSGRLHQRGPGDDAFILNPAVEDRAVSLNHEWTQRGGAATKSEIRISKSETNPNEKSSKFEATSRSSLENLRIGILHLFRASDFEFRI